MSTREQGRLSGGNKYICYSVCQEAQLPHLVRVSQQLMPNAYVGDVYASHEAFLCCACFLLVSLLICVTSTLAIL
jgi:hypothetical protein